MNNFPASQDVSKSKFCLMYFSIILIIIIIIIVNYFETRNAFEENKIFEFRPNNICLPFINELDICKKIESNCNEKVIQVKQCYTDVIKDY